VDEEEPPPSDAEESEDEGDAGADSDVENVLRLVLAKNTIRQNIF
jgi:hypothetical protein